MRVLAVDPGRDKCGVAVCVSGTVLARRVVDLRDLEALSAEWVTAYGVEVVLVGDQTGCKQVFDILAHVHRRVERVPERGSTLAARGLYFRDHPPRGWRRLLPLSFQVPPEPYDDYAAVALAEEYLRHHGVTGRG